jgi:vesicle-associated membrane protein 7
LSQFGDTWQNAIALKFNHDFARVIKTKMEFHSDVNSDKIASLRNQIDQAKDVIIENIDKLVERQERIDILVTKTQELQDTSTTFKSKATSMKNRFWWKNVKLIVIISTLVLLILFLVVWFACGVPSFQSCTGAPSPSPSPPNPPSPVTPVPPIPLNNTTIL